MRKEPNKKLIGLFVVVGAVIFALLIAGYIRKELFPPKENMIVMYFDESVKGLSVGSPVVFKGVEIGKVAKIDLIANPENMEFRIPVYVKLGENKLNPYGKRAFYGDKMLLDALIKKGLRARLISQNYLTGQLMIELEMLPDTPIKLRSNREHVLEIPTVLSPIGELSKNMQRLPIRETLDKLNSILGTIDKQLPDIMPEITSIAKSLNKIVMVGSKDSSGTLSNLNKTLFDISEAAKSIRLFMEYLERHPEAFIKGKKGVY